MFSCSDASPVVNVGDRGNADTVNIDSNGFLIISEDKNLLSQQSTKVLAFSNPTTMTTG